MFQASPLKHGNRRNGQEFQKVNPRMVLPGFYGQIRVAESTLKCKCVHLVHSEKLKAIDNSKNLFSKCKVMHIPNKGYSVFIIFNGSIFLKGF